jgi:nucleoside diphosphate kinase
VGEQPISEAVGDDMHKGDHADSAGEESDYEDNNENTRVVVTVTAQATQRGLLGKIIEAFETKRMIIVGMKYVKPTVESQAKLKEILKDSNASPIRGRLEGAPNVIIVLESVNAFRTAHQVVTALRKEKGYDGEGRKCLLTSSTTKRMAAEEIALWFEPHELVPNVPRFPPVKSSEHQLAVVTGKSSDGAHARPESSKAKVEGSEEAKSKPELTMEPATGSPAHAEKPPTDRGKDGSEPNPLTEKKREEPSANKIEASVRSDYRVKFLTSESRPLTLEKRLTFTRIGRSVKIDNSYHVVSVMYGLPIQS